MTAKNAFEAQPHTPADTILIDCLLGIHRATRRVATRRRERRCERLVESDEPDHRESRRADYRVSVRAHVLRSVRSALIPAACAGGFDRMTRSTEGTDGNNSRRAISLSLLRNRLRVTCVCPWSGTTRPNRGCPRSLARQQMSIRGVRRRRPLRWTAVRSEVRVRRQPRGSPSGFNSLRASKEY